MLEHGGNEIHVAPEIGSKAVVCIDRMLNFAAERKARVAPGPEMAKETQLFAGIGPA